MSSVKRDVLPSYGRNVVDINTRVPGVTDFGYHGRIEENVLCREIPVNDWDIRDEPFMQTLIWLIASVDGCV